MQLGAHGTRRTMPLDAPMSSQLAQPQRTRAPWVFWMVGAVTVVIGTLPLWRDASPLNLLAALGLALGVGGLLWLGRRTDGLVSDPAISLRAGESGAARAGDGPLASLLSQVLPVWHEHVVMAQGHIDGAVNDLITNVSSVTDQFEAAGFRGAGGAESGQDKQALILHCEQQLQEVIDLMSQLTQGKEQMSRSMKDLMSAAQDLQTMAEGVAQIAAQTNLLAINAAIEAAHAGDSGKGFATVAKEIRFLSQSSASTASQIRERISRVTDIIQSASQSTAQATAREAQAIGSSSGSVHQVLDAMRDLSAQADDMRTRGNVTRHKVEQLIVSLQFQDRVNQVIALVDADITRLRDQVQAQAPLPEPQTWLDDLQRQYTMREQRQPTTVPTEAKAGAAAPRKVVFF